jgi:hypothetical protein
MTDYTVIESPNYRVRIINDPYAGDPWIDDEVWHLASWSSRIPGENGMTCYWPDELKKEAI